MVGSWSSSVSEEEGEERAVVGWVSGAKSESSEERYSSSSGGGGWEVERDILGWLMGEVDVDWVMGCEMVGDVLGKWTRLDEIRLD